MSTLFNGHTDYNGDEVANEDMFEVQEVGGGGGSGNCPAPSVSYNGSVLTGGVAPAAPHHWNNGVPVFNDVREVSFVTGLEFQFKINAGRTKVRLFCVLRKKLKGVGINI